MLSDCKVMEKSALSASGSSLVTDVVFVLGLDVDADVDALVAPGVKDTCPRETVESIIVMLLSATWLLSPVPGSVIAS